MECHYHPGKESTNTCALCGKPVCEECSLEIAGKVYCKPCLEKIVGIGTQNDASQEAEPIKQRPVETEPTIAAPDNTIYQPKEEVEIPYTPQEEIPSREFKGISDDSPYNIKETIEFTGGLESSYTTDEEVYQKPQIEQQPVVQKEEIVMTQPSITEEDTFIYPDHTYEPPKTSARQELEDKYEKYLDDLYFDESDIPLGEQLAKDEEQYGSLTRKEYPPRAPEVVEEIPKVEKKIETPDEIEARIRAEIMEEQKSSKKGKRFSLRNKKQKEAEEPSIHNINYKNEKEPMGVVDILLTIILIIVILIVLYYVIYLFILSSTYPTFMDAVFALKNPQNVINTLLTQL